MKKLHQALLALLLIDVAYRLLLRERLRRMIHGPKFPVFTADHRPIVRQMNRQMYRRLVAARAQRQ